MKTLQVNIGMVNNPFSAEQIATYFSNNKNYRLMAYTFEVGEYKGEEEVTFVGLFEYKYANQSTIIKDFELFCGLFNQDMIAIVTEYTQTMVYNTSYTGEGLKFREDLFHSLTLN